MNELTWVLSGLLAGALAGRVLRGEGYGVIGSLLIGSAGGIVGGWLFQRVLGVTSDGTLPMHFLTSLVGGVMFVVGVRVLDRAARAAVGPHRSYQKEGLELESAIHRLGALERRVLDKLISRQSAVTDPNAEFEAQATFGQRVADQVAKFGGSWTFIGLFLLMMAVWMLFNANDAVPFDPYPFILLNLVLSCMAALQAPVIMMSQNRQSVRDRIDAQNDYQVNLNAEMQILGLHAKFDTVIADRLRILEEQQAVQMALLERLAGSQGGGEP
ncbi:MAG: DUF1003 domain-containing protein [Gemmatimonadota bacterium]|nr:DUF1003 domain-containing protein [Gemmatimonadota bacterium]